MTYDTVKFIFFAGTIAMASTIIAFRLGKAVGEHEASVRCKENADPVRF